MPPTSSEALPALHIVYPGEAEKAFIKGKKRLAQINSKKRAYRFDVSWLEIKKPSPRSEQAQPQSKSTAILRGVSDPSISQSPLFFNELCYATETHLLGIKHGDVYFNFKPTDFSHNKPISFGLSYWNPDYPHVERKILINKLNQAFNASVNTPNQATIVVVCHGLGGAGKSHLVADYARQNTYRIKGQMDANKLEASFRTLGESLNLFKGSPEKIKTKECAKIVKDWLEQHPGWLLIFEDVTDYAAIKEYIPQKNGHVIITSRQHHWPEKNLLLIEVGMMLENEAVKLLQGLSTLDDQALPELKNISSTPRLFTARIRTCRRLP